MKRYQKFLCSMLGCAFSLGVCGSFCACKDLPIGEKQFSVTAGYDYGMHEGGKATLLYDHSTSFFDLPDGMEYAVAGDVFTITHTGTALVQETYPSTVVFKKGEIREVTVQQAKIVRLEYYAPYEGNDAYFVLLNDDGTSERITVRSFPAYYIEDMNGEYASLSDVSDSKTLFGSYVADTGYDSEKGYTFAGLYECHPRFA